jgi:tetratricopeptide (TPR) repeat protein
MFYAEMGERKEALRELAEALRINHTSREPYAMLEQVFERTGLGEDARKLLSGSFKRISRQ